MPAARSPRSTPTPPRSGGRRCWTPSRSLTSDALTEKYLETGDLPAGRHRRRPAGGDAERGELQPVFCGSSLHRVGVQPLLDGVVRYLPSPLDRGAVTGTHPNPKKEGEPQVVREPDPAAPVAALAFKIVADKHGDLYFVRVYSGTLKTGSRLLNPAPARRNWSIRSGGCRPTAARRSTRPAPAASSAWSARRRPSPATRCAIRPGRSCWSRSGSRRPSSAWPSSRSQSADRKKLDDTMARLARQDPTFDARLNPETGQTIVSGMGELHLEVIKNRMEREFNLKIRVHKPRVSYRETVKAGPPIAGRGEFDRPLPEGQVDHAVVTVSLERFESGRTSDLRLRPAARLSRRQTLEIVKQSGPRRGPRRRRRRLPAERREADGEERGSRPRHDQRHGPRRPPPPVRCGTASRKRTACSWNRR